MFLPKKLIITLAASLAFASAANAAVVVSNWNVTGDIVSFDITGIIDPSFVMGDRNENNIYVGVPGLTTWIASSGLTRNIVNNPGGSRGFSDSVGGYITGSIGDYVFLRSSDDLDFVIGDTFNSTIEISGGTINNAALPDASTMIVTAGWTEVNNILPDPAQQIGTVVPEPSSYAALAGMTAFALVALRRRR